RFFDDPGLEQEFLHRIRAAMDATGFWTEYATDWACLDCELMPWSAKAQELIRQQYAATGAAAHAALGASAAVLQRAAENGIAVEALRDKTTGRLAMTEQYIAAYRRYCWPVESIADLKLAPFHLLATEGHVHADKDHRWHMEALARICAADADLLL